MGGCGGGAGVGGGGFRARPAAGRVALRGGPAPALDPFPVQGRSSLFAFLQVAYHCWASCAGVCVRRPGDAHALWQCVVGVLRSMPVACCMRASGSVGRVWRCALWICVLLMGGGWCWCGAAAHAAWSVAVCARGSPSSAYASTSCLSRPVLPRRLWRVVGWVGFLSDVIGGVESALWGCYPSLALAHGVCVTVYV